MSENKSSPAGNLKNRIENNLKLSIPNSNKINRTCPSTAPAMSERIPSMKIFMQNWKHDSPNIDDEDHFTKSPCSNFETPLLTSKSTQKECSTLIN